MAAQLRAAILLVAAAAAVGIQALSTEEWQEQSIYSIITDRFALSNGAGNASEDCTYRKYCGGTWKGIEEHLDYIQGMGFTAIWLSPIIKQIAPGTEYGCVLIFGFAISFVFAIGPNQELWKLLGLAP